MLVTCSIGRTSHQSLILYIVAINIYNITRSNRGTGDPLHSFPASPSKNGTTLSSQTTSMQEVLNVVSTHRIANETTHHRTEIPSRVSRSLSLPLFGKLPVSVETRTRVSSKAATPRFGKIPSADGIERSNDRSDAIIGPAVEQALTLFSSEVGEGRRVPDTVVSIHNGEKRDVRSPSLETTRKGSHPPSTHAMVEGGGQLARAAAYIRERSTRRSPAFDKFICRTLKAPLDKTTESDTIRHVPDVASEGKRFSEAVESLQPHSDVETFPSQPETQRLSKERSESIPKFAEPACDTSDVGGQEWRTVQLVEAVEADRRSAEHLEEIKEISDELVMPALEEAEQPPNLMERQPELLAVSKAETSAQSHSPIPSAALTPLAPLPAILSRAMSINQPSLGLDWLLLKPPDGVGFKQCPYDTVSVSFTSSVTLRSPEFEMGFNPISQPGHVWADSASHPSSLELVWWERIKPPNMAACRRFLREAVKTLSRRTGLATHCSWPTLHRDATTPVVSYTPRLRGFLFPSRVVDVECHVVFVC